MSCSLFFHKKVFLDHRAKDEVGQLVGAKTHGATPLVMACRNGHYDVAEYLIEKCGADVEQPGSGESAIPHINGLVQVDELPVCIRIFPVTISPQRNTHENLCSRVIRKIQARDENLGRCYGANLSRLLDVQLDQRISVRLT